MKYWSEGDHCNQNDHDDAVDAFRWATSNYNAAIGKVTDLEQTKDGLKIHVEPISGYKPTKGLTFNKIKEEIEKSMNKKTVKDVDRIVITKNDLNEVLLRAYSGDQIVEKTIAKCSPDDIFDFNIGAKLAVDRLYDGYDMTPKPKRKLYNGKIFARATMRSFFGFWDNHQENSILEVRNGIIIGFEGRRMDLIWDDMTDEELSKLLCDSNYMPSGFLYNFIDGYFVR